MKTSEALQLQFERKIAGRLEALIHAPSPIRVTFMVENDQYKMHVEMHSRDHSIVEVTETSVDMQKTIDLAVETLYGILSRNKDKQVSHHGKAQAKFASTSPASPAEGSWDEDEEDNSSFLRDEFGKVLTEI